MSHDDENNYRYSAELLADCHLDFGEIVPLSFISEQVSQDKYSFHTPTLILSFPTQRLNHSVDMSPQLQDIGLSLANLFHTHAYFQQKRVLWVASGDLAHSHVPWGPYGYNPAADRYEDAIKAWIKAINTQRLLNSSWSDVEEEQAAGAMSCGFTGLAMIHGVMRSTCKEWRSHLYELLVPTYYGMMVSSWSRVKNHYRWFEDNEVVSIPK